MNEVAGAVLALWNDVTPELDAEYNDWHANEHVPERLEVPGMLWGRRYANVDGSAVPRYLTLYGLRDSQVLESASYQRLLREPTPASARMRPHLCQISRWVCRLHAQGDFLGADALAVWTFEAEAEARGQARQEESDALLAERIPDAAPLPWLSSDQAHTIRGNWLMARRARGGREESLPLRGALMYSALPVKAVSRRA
ncbi:hypothetical protein J7E62_20445 [Variovorax paradoxus]|nr:hypothetical protein [Variovorax paradoxus]